MHPGCNPFTPAEMSKRKVLFVIDSFATGGAEKSLLDIIPRMPSITSVVCGVYADQSLLGQYRQAGITTLHLNLKGKYEWRRAFLLLSEVVERERPQIIHSTLFRSNILSRLLARKYKLKLVTSLVSDSYGEVRIGQMSLARKLKLYAIRLLDKRTVSLVDLFIANSRSVRSSNADILGIPPENIQVIYRGREGKRFMNDRAVEVAQLRAWLNLGENEFVFLNVGRLVESKGQLDLIKVMPSIVAVYPETRLLIAGEGPFRHVLENAISESGMEVHVSLLGNRMDVPALLKLAHVFVFPTYYEGHSGALIEAMFSGVPILASDIGPNAETLNDATGTMFSAGNPEELKGVMIASIKNYDHLCKKSVAALKYAVDNFEVENVAGTYEHLYRQLTLGPKP